MDSILAACRSLIVVSVGSYLPIQAAAFSNTENVPSRTYVQMRPVTVLPLVRIGTVVSSPCSRSAARMAVRDKALSRLPHRALSHRIKRQQGITSDSSAASIFPIGSNKPSLPFFFYKTQSSCCLGRSAMGHIVYGDINNKLSIGVVSHGDYFCLFLISSSAFLRDVKRPK